MKSQMDRKAFLQVTVATTLTGLVGCGGDDSGGGGDGDGDMMGDGDGDVGTGGSMPGTGGTSATGGATSTGGESPGTGGDTPATGGDASTGGSDGTGGGAGAECGSVMAMDTNTFHQHVLAVTPADVAAGAEKMYTVSMAGQGPHDHDVILTAADFESLANGETVTVDMEADGTGHTHSYVISCQLTQ